MLTRLVTNKKWLVIVPVALALAVTVLFLPVREVSIDPYGRLSLETKVTLSIGSGVAYAHPALPVYRSFNEGKNAGGTSVAVTKPLDTSDGDLLIGCLSSDAIETHTSPESDSWTVIYKNQSEASGKQTFSIWWKKAGASEPATYTFGCGSSEGLYAWVMRIDGQHATTPIHQKNISTGDSTEVSCPAVTTTVNDCLIIRAFGADHRDVTVNGGWGSETNITVDESDAGNGAASGGSAYKDLATKGNSGAETNTLTDTEEWVGVTVAIQPPAPDILNEPDTYPFGIVGEGDTKATGLTHFTITNNSAFAVDIAIKGTDLSNGPKTWDLADDGNPGTDIYALKAGLDGGSYDIIVKKTEAYNPLKSELGAGLTQKWGLEIHMPTTISQPENCTNMSGTVTLIASAS